MKLGASHVYSPSPAAHRSHQEGGMPEESPAPVKIPDFCHVTPLRSDQSS